MNINILSGKYTIKEAEQLLNNLLKMNEEYQMIKTSIVGSSDRETAHTEHQLSILKKHLKDAINDVKKSGERYITLHSNITIEYSPGYFNA